MGDFDIVVTDAYFDKLAYGNISDIVLVNNAKVKKIKQGNHFFVINEETRQQFEAIAQSFLYFESLADAFDMVGKKYLGFAGNVSVTKLEDKFLTMYKAEDVDKYGIVVVNFERI